MVTKTLTAGFDGRIVDQSAFDKAQAGLQQIKDFLDAKFTKWNGVQPLTEEETRDRLSEFHRAYGEQFTGDVIDDHGQKLQSRTCIQTPLPKLVQHFINKNHLVRLREKLIGKESELSKANNRINDFITNTDLNLDMHDTTHGKLEGILKWLKTLGVDLGGNNSATKMKLAHSATSSEKIASAIDQKRIQPVMDQASPTTDEAINLGWAKLNHFASDSLQFMPKIDTED
ncbi:MAG: hypothetical protein LW817_00600 [Candidatus Caenarcaniphilales bacterium]|jgi:hypothetical protein|nr:hypothetical protein [Candidatus Caenarcaniphilales bacterium]